MREIRHLLLLACTLASAACQQPASHQSGAGDDWPSPGGDAGKSHFSRLQEIAPDNVARIGLAWSADLPGQRGMEATPVVVDGVLYVSGQAGYVGAFDAASGKPLWEFTPEIRPEAYRTACCDTVNRGVALADGVVYVAALDGILYALDAGSGEVLWQADTIEQGAGGLVSTGAPEVAGDVVVIGNSGAEYGTRGYVSAYDRKSGDLRWRFHVVPRDPALGPQDHPDLEAALATWPKDTLWDMGGGGAPWDAIAYDSETGLVLVGTGNGGPYYRAARSPGGGDNLYLSSIVALDPETGRVAWHYQEVPGDSWDYTATQPMVLADLDIDGETTPVIIHAPKNGFLYLIDRRSGRLLDAHRLVRTNWADSIDIETGRPNLTPASSDYSQGPKIVFPATVGARNWQAGAFDPDSGIYFAPVVDMGNLMIAQPGPYEHRDRALNLFASVLFTAELENILPGLPPAAREEVEKLPEMDEVRKAPWISELRAIDVVTGQTVWSQPMEGWQDRGGVLATASGLVVQGNLAGALRFFDAGSGKLLRAVQTGRSIMAAPMTYSVDGVQYIALTTGWGGGGWPYVPAYSAAYRYGNANKLLVFRLDGKPVPMPEPLPPLEVTPDVGPRESWETPAAIAQGEGLFMANCGICHANHPRSTAPDLTRLMPGVQNAFSAIVSGGLLETRGMPAWGDLLSEDEVRAIQAYLRDLQRRNRQRDLQLQAEGLPLDRQSTGMTLAK
ncbi:PQQ-dependent dehydrogenase, methanol/ethanol family [Aurantiacibacter xanthus]|uniref:PQQ-dependent dehydrogenase, methanol/ethanol family n=1 Tax=Aurantiacibacter xanthus TaxID=1784712 RepID=A0A3A1NY64_9SPHN|nr:PQQ-dependent dehydrogenase, methanol/ethanol family [Aurantiacibacter xanthus]RIV80068.1 PQQ-dependent dehydrogenase, methanol/ethanol family [Aurantiacibacter xanthus]